MAVASVGFQVDFCWISPGVLGSLIMLLGVHCGLSGGQGGSLMVSVVGSLMDQGVRGLLGGQCNLSGGQGDLRQSVQAL